VFAAGLVVMEIASGVPLVPGDTEISQLQLYVRVLGGAEADETMPIPSNIATWASNTLAAADLTTNNGAARRRHRLREMLLQQKPGFFAETLVQLEPQHASTAAPMIDSFFDLVARMLAFDPESRITASQALTHVFFVHARQVGWI